MASVIPSVSVEFDAESLTTMLSFIDFCLDIHLQKDATDVQQTRESIIKTRNQMGARLIDVVGTCDVPAGYKPS